MNCLLLLLAVGLVTSDKLDRTYLPPPGAKLSGGSLDDLLIPLEYPKETNIEPISNGQYPGIIPEKTSTSRPSHQSPDSKLKSTVPIDYSTTTYPVDLSQTTLFPASVYDSTVATSRSNLGIYDYFPPKSGTQTPQSNNFPTSSPGFETTSTSNSFTEPSGDAESPGYYYYGPELQSYENKFINQGNSNVGFSYDPNSGYQYPNPVNDGYLSGEGPAFIPRMATTNEIAQNYHPSAFGYYGGNPMIMTTKNSSPRDFDNKGLASKFGDYKINVPTSSVSQDKQDTYERKPVRLFQTPLVRTIVPNENKAGIKTSTLSSNNVDQEQFPMTKSYSFINENTPPKFNQRSGILVPELRRERPQAESDKNAVILNYKNLITPEGFSYSFDTSNGIHADESGTANNGVKAKGSYSYTGDDGKIYSVSYIADENGFQPTGDHLPTPPPIPEAIKKVIEQAARDKAAGIIDDGFYDERKYGHMKYQGAMDRYRPYKNSDRHYVDQKSGTKASRLNGAQRRPALNDRRINSKGVNKTPIYNGGIPRMNEKSFSQSQDKRPSYMVRNQEGSKNRTNIGTNIGNINELPTKNQQISSRLGPVSDANDNQQSFFNKNNADNLPQKNEMSGKNLVSTETLTGNNSPNQNEQVSYYKNARFNTSVNDYTPITNKERPTTERSQPNQNSYLRYIPENMSAGILNNIQNQPNQLNQMGINKQSTGAVTGEGYYYVPPFIKFNPNPKQSSFNKDSFGKSNKLAQQDLEATVNKRTGLDSSQSKQIISDITTLTPATIPKNTDSTRNTYINGPNDQESMLNYANTQVKVPDQNGRNKDTTYMNDLNLSLYESTTTPMSLQTTQYGSQPTERFNQYYQTTINPASFDQTLRNNVENRVYLPSGIPGISVSQDFVTTTYKPATFGDGINLEVNQNVKIYGLGGSEPTIATRRYPDNVSIYNDEFLTTIPPNAESRFTSTYPNSLFGQPIQDTTVNQETINQDKTYGNEFYTTGNILPNIGSDSIGPYVNPDFGIQTEVNTPGIYRSPTFSPGSEMSSQDLTTSFNGGESATQRVIWEDFSGPKQPQGFDPITGYYYK